MNITYEKLNLEVNFMELHRIYDLLRNNVYESIKNEWKYHKLDTFKNNEYALPFLKKIAPFIDEDFERDVKLFEKLLTEEQMESQTNGDTKCLKQKIRQKKNK